MKQPHEPKGAELAARGKAAGLTQRQLAETAGVGRTAVQYWEAAPHLDPRGWAVVRMTEALGWAVRLASETTTHPRGDGVLSLAERMDALAAAQLAAFKDREAQRAARRRIRCGAKTRKGTSCRNKSEPGKRRCKFHGGAVHRSAHARGHRAYSPSPAPPLGQGAGQVSFRADRQPGP
ncbi:HGGxSTG domain-containing protein [Paracoccus niistensis]|uniref:HGGxSTG domain-containing protein n=1 Tax=Paracoccus niistensis TaxID=632935 RepID=A0ABV6I7B7_9RHOB